MGRVVNLITVFEGAEIFQQYPYNKIIVIATDGSIVNVDNERMLLKDYVNWFNTFNNKEPVLSWKWPKDFDVIQRQEMFRNKEFSTDLKSSISKYKLPCDKYFENQGCK